MGALLPMALSCSSTGPNDGLPAGAVAVTAPAAFRQWFLRTESCSQLTGSFDTLEFFVVPGVQSFETSEGQKVGLWIEGGPRDQIVIAGNFFQHEMVVSHEMLHALLGRSGHPPLYFEDRCHLTWETFGTTA